MAADWLAPPRSSARHLKPYGGKKTIIDASEALLPLLVSTPSGAIAVASFLMEIKERDGPLPGHLVHGNLGYARDNSRVIPPRALGVLASLVPMIAQRPRNEARYKLAE